MLAQREESIPFFQIWGAQHVSCTRLQQPNRTGKPSVQRFLVHAATQRRAEEDTLPLRNTMKTALLVALQNTGMHIPYS